VSLRRTLQTTRDGAAIGAIAGRLAGQSASVDLLAAVPPLIAELAPAAALGAGPPDLELLGASADRAVSGESSHPAPRWLSGSRPAATAARPLAPTDDRPLGRGPVAAGFAAPTGTSSVLSGDDDSSTRRLSPVALVEGAFRRLDRSGRGVIDRHVGVPQVPAAVPAAARRHTDDLVRNVTHHPRPADLGRAGADVSEWQPAPAPPTVTSVRGAATTQDSSATDPGRVFAEVGGGDSLTTSRSPAADDTAGTVMDLRRAGSVDVARRLTDLPELFATDAVQAPSAKGEGDDPAAASADRRTPSSPAVDAAELEELLAELLAREAEAHGLDGRVT
jgi:hypothetical protein